MVDHRKIAVGVEEVERLRHEAAVLEAVRHPGVVELLGFTDEGGVAELRTAGVDGPALAAAPDDALSDNEVAGLAAAVATTLADLHQAGFVHGAVDASHVLLGSTGPVLCGFAAAGSPGPHRQPADDIAALSRLVLDRVQRGPVADAARTVQTQTAREAAATFRACGATVTLPGRAPGRDGDELADLLGRGARQRRRRPALRWIVGMMVVAIAAVGGVALMTARSAPAPVAVAEPRATTTTIPPTTTTGPTATLVWPPATGPTPTFEIGGQGYSAGQPGDVVLTGPFGCDGAGGPAAVLRPANGRVFVFSELASHGHDIEARQVATVIGGRSLRAEDVDGDGCMDLLVERSGGAAPVPVALDRGATS